MRMFMLRACVCTRAGGLGISSNHQVGGAFPACVFASRWIGGAVVAGPGYRCQWDFWLVTMEAGYNMIVSMYLDVKRPRTAFACYDPALIMLRFLPALFLAVLAGPGRASAQAWSMPGLNDLPALPGVAKDIMHSITSGARPTQARVPCFCEKKLEEQCGF